MYDLFNLLSSIQIFNNFKTLLLIVSVGYVVCDSLTHTLFLFTPLTNIHSRHSHAHLFNSVGLYPLWLLITGNLVRCSFDLSPSLESTLVGVFFDDVLCDQR